jgi:hypothetical protein
MEISAESMAEAVLQATATNEFDLGKGHVSATPPNHTLDQKNSYGGNNTSGTEATQLAPQRDVTGTANQLPMEKTPRGNNPTRRTMEEKTKTIGD